VRSSSEGTDGVDDFAYSASMLLAALTINATRAETLPPDIPAACAAKRRLEWPFILPEMQEMDSRYCGGGPLQARQIPVQVFPFVQG